MSLLDEEERGRIKAFDWKAEFPQVFKAGGFDAVIGNPPYISIQTMNETNPDEVSLLQLALRCRRVRELRHLCRFC